MRELRPASGLSGPEATPSEFDGDEADSALGDPEGEPRGPWLGDLDPLL